MGRKWFVVGVAAVVSGCCWASVAEDYAQPVRPVGVNGQEAWNRRSVWFMYAPTFAFTNRTDAASYAFEVTDAKGARHAFVAKSANAALSPVWTDLPVGWTKVVCEARDAYRLTKDVRYREAADRAFGYVERGPLTSWNWEGQFEDVPPTGKFHNLTKHGACDTALYLLRRFPGDARRLAQARELLRFSEDQFVCWELPLYADAALKKAHFGVWGEMQTWRCPAVLEQYNCYVPIDASSAKLVRTYLALYRAEGNPVDLAKARALGDAIVRETDDKGRLPTFWFDSWEMWPNCMIASARALSDLADRR